jgi:hypothetical protein
MIMEDLNYLYSRHQISLDNSTGAACGSSRSSHLAMAKAYGLRIDSARSKAGATSVIPLPSKFDHHRVRLSVNDALLTDRLVNSVRSNATNSNEGWENEGGALASTKDKVDAQALANSRQTRLDLIGRLERSLREDVSNGVVGTRFNTLQHRERVIRQLRADHDLLPTTVRSGISQYD